MLPYFLHSAAYLDMSEFETFPLPLAQAMFLKLPVLCRRTPATRQLLGEDALYLPESDMALSAGLMNRVAKDAKLRSAMIIRAKDRLGAFTWAVQQEKLTRVIQDMVGAGPVQMTMMKKKAGE